MTEFDPGLQLFIYTLAAAVLGPVLAALAEWRWPWVQLTLGYALRRGVLTWGPLVVWLAYWAYAGLFCAFPPSPEAHISCGNSCWVCPQLCIGGGG